MSDQIRYASISWSEIQGRRAQRGKQAIPSGLNVHRNKILVRFREFISGEQLSSADVAFFMSHAQSWWLLTSNEEEREFAQRVLARLGMALMKREDEEAEHG